MAPPIDIWAGMECTVNRVHDRYFDQLEATGHAAREDDLDRFAALGIRTLRQPVLWDRVVMNADHAPRWDWSDRRMARLQTLGIRPVVGLLHHGSGPAHTSLVDRRFPEQFAHYAEAVARRYPWVTLWILINEPLTTARFSCLYGHWYPHVCDDRMFARAIVGQCRAIARAAIAIRAVNPEARLIQSEDLGRTFSTPLLSYQSGLENDRRWLTFDLLCGRVRRGHVMWEWLRLAGADLDELAWLAEHPSPPDLLGINHYLTSERFLDERLERYPVRWYGGNGRHRYADVEAVRVCAEGPAGMATLLREAWDRYRIPIAVTEAHLDCSREEQVRWLTEMRDMCERLSRNGVPIVALTVWSLLGSYNWNELMTTNGDYYESGVFDVRGGTPRPTRLATVVRCWTSGQVFDHPALDGSGWWHRPVRLLYPPVSRGETVPIQLGPRVHRRRHIVIAGATAAVQRHFELAAHLRDLPIHFLAHEAADLDVGDALADGPWAIVVAGVLNVLNEANTSAGLFDVARAAAVVSAAAAVRCHVILLSSQQVFGRTRHDPYRETDVPAPRTAIGRLALEAERALATIDPPALVARAAACFTDCAEACVGGGPRDLFPPDIAAGAACSLTYLPDLVRVVLDLAIDGERGTWHLANRGVVRVAEVMAMAGTPLLPDTAGSVDRLVAEPYLLHSERAPLLPRVGDALERAGYGSSIAPS
jgi:dTDP-4-dehydrorhamnose reductase